MYLNLTVYALSIAVNEKESNSSRNGVTNVVMFVYEVK